MKWLTRSIELWCARLLAHLDAGRRARATLEGFGIIAWVFFAMVLAVIVDGVLTLARILRRLTR